MPRLVTLEELHAGNDVAWKNDEFLTLVNQDFPKHWVKMNKNVPYAPVGKVKFLLTAIFRGLWRLEVVEVKQILNSVQATVRLHYYHPNLEVWEWQDGVGADKIQVAKETKAMNWDGLIADAVQKAAPSSISYALKNAAQKIGRIFGGDIEGEEPMFEPFKPYQEEQKQAVQEAIQAVKPAPKAVAPAPVYVAPQPQPAAPVAPSFNAPLQF